MFIYFNNIFIHNNYVCVQDKTIECKFALGSIANIVGRGYILVTGSTNIHGEEIGDNYRGAIEFADQPDALLINPIPNSDIYTIKQAIGTLIRWPKSLVIFPEAAQVIILFKTVEFEFIYFNINYFWCLSGGCEKNWRAR